MTAQLTKLVRLFLSLSLMLWLSGVGCVFVCGNEAMAAMADHAHGAHSLKIASTEVSAASMHHHASCHHSAATPARPVSKSNSTGNLVHPQTLLERVALAGPESMQHRCPLADNGLALSTSVRPGESANALAVAPTALAVTDLSQFSTTRSAPSLISNRGHTYLRCCVFLI